MRSLPYVVNRETSNCVLDRRLYGWEDPRKPMLWTKSLDIAHKFVLRAGGKSLDTIIIGDDIYEKQKNGKDIVGDFQRSCPNVRSLSVVEPSGVCSSAFAGKPEKLEVASTTFPKDFPSLRELIFFYSRNAQNDFVPLDVRGIDWEYIGGKLESLVLSRASVSQGELKVMRKHCQKLNHIDIASRIGGNGNTAEFISSYGDQLEIAHVEEMAVSELNNVVGKCSNAGFHVTIEMDELGSN